MRHFTLALMTTSQKDMPMIDLPRQPVPEMFHPLQWPKAAVALHMLATSGSSVRYEITKAVADQFCIRTDGRSLGHMFDTLSVRGMTVTEKYSVIQGIHLVAMRLTPKGKDYCASLGWDPVENEWERLLRLHSADSQPRHAGAVIAFSYGARLRGWKVQALPQTGIPRFLPDVLVEKGGERHYVEVELGNRKDGKWLLAQKTQGYVALCARTPIRRESLVVECADLGVYGLATDLRTLYLSRDVAGSPLWDQHWTVADNFTYMPTRYYSGSADYFVK
jgi:hypothetical protein